MFEKGWFMRTIETNGMVDERGNLVIPMPDDIPQGEHRVVIVIDVPEQDTSHPQSEMLETEKKWPPPQFKVFNAGMVDLSHTLRREELYDTDRG
jgi:hypothetical protein